jgi:hypothetical protein
MKSRRRCRFSRPSRSNWSSTCKPQGRSVSPSRCRCSGALGAVQPVSRNVPNLGPRVTIVDNHGEAHFPTRRALVQPSSWRRMGLRWTAMATSISARCRGPTGRKLSETSHGRIICARCRSSGRWYRSVNAQPTKFDLVIKPDYREGARPHGAADATRPRRRGDRIAGHFCCAARVPIGTKRRITF